MTESATPILYRIRDWDKHFEKNRTRDLVKMTWVPMPNKQDGDGYTELLNHKDGAAHYGTWCAILNVASKCSPRGTLVRDGGRPHDFTSLQRITRVPAKTIECAMARLVSIGWLEACTISHEGAAIPHKGAVLFSPVISSSLSASVSSQAVELSNALADSIAGWKPDYRGLHSDRRKQTVARWAKDIDSALRLDKRKPETVRAIIDWLPSHEGRDGFRWRDQILSGKKLRAQYDKLDIAKNRTVAAKPSVISVFDE